MHTLVGPKITFCEDTPANWADFHRLARAITEPHKYSPTRGASNTQELNRVLQAQTARENRRLRSLRTYLPGTEPDHF